MARDLMSSKKNRGGSARRMQGGQQATGNSWQAGANEPAAGSRQPNSTAQQPSNSQQPQNAGGMNMGNMDMGNVDMGQVNSVVNSMQGKSEKEMQDELFRVADEQFAAGNVNIDDIDAFAKQAAGMLNPEQQKKLNMLTGMLKNKARNR